MLGRIATVVSVLLACACSSTSSTGTMTETDAGADDARQTGDPVTTIDAAAPVVDPPSDGGSDADPDDAGSDPMACTGGKPPPTEVSNDCYAAGRCVWENLCGPDGVQYVCGTLDSKLRPDIAGCRNHEELNATCCKPVCVRMSSYDNKCEQGELAYSCPEDNAGVPTVPLPADCRKMPGATPGYGVCCST